MYPSRGTCSNDMKMLNNQKDIDALADEYYDIPAEKIVLTHTGIRLNDPMNSRSGYTIDSVLAVRFYLESFEYGAHS